MIDGDVVGVRVQLYVPVTVADTVPEEVTESDEPNDGVLDKLAVPEVVLDSVAVLEDDTVIETDALTLPDCENEGVEDDDTDDVAETEADCVSVGLLLPEVEADGDGVTVSVIELEHEVDAERVEVRVAVGDVDTEELALPL